MLQLRVELDARRARLIAALERGRSVAYCHRLWSEFVRFRDGSRCVVCGATEYLSAHHILRKSFLECFRFEPGNGISLCKGCHQEAHAIFNGKADVSYPMDAQGGEKIELMSELLGYLAFDAKERGLLSDHYYYLSDGYLSVCKRFQGLPSHQTFPGTRLEQAYWIWKQTPRETLQAILRENGLELPRNFIQVGPISIIC